MTDKISLADAITELRAEIQEAMDRAQNQKLRLGLDMIELELQVTAEKTTEVGGKIVAWFVDLGGKRTAGDGHTHTVRLKLSPELVQSDGDHVSPRRTGRVYMNG